MSDQEKLKLLKEALEQVKADLDGFIDADDGDEGPVPNFAMRICSDVDRALAQVAKPSPVTAYDALSVAAIEYRLSVAAREGAMEARDQWPTLETEAVFETCRESELKALARLETARRVAAETWSARHG